jgi:NhaP-type Na+/H+ or K+/H+ antiporter
LCIVLVFGVVEAAGRGSIDPLRMVGTIMASMLFAGLLGVVGGIAWMRFLPLVRRLPNTIAASVAFVLVVYGVTELLGFSGGIAALAFGITLTNHERFTVVETLAKRPGTTVGATLLPAERQVFSEAVFLLKTLFFVYLGVSIKFGSVLAFGGAVLITALVYLGRLVLASRLLSRDTPFRDATIVSVMIPKGLAAAVLASVPVQAGLEGGATIRDATYAVVLLSLITTSAMGFASERAPLRAVYERIFHRFPREAPAPQALPSGQVGADGGAGSAVEPSSQS